jgi:hypothetical protein
MSCFDAPREDVLAFTRSRIRLWTRACAFGRVHSGLGRGLTPDVALRGVGVRVHHALGVVMSRVALRVFVLAALEQRVLFLARRLGLIGHGYRRIL